MSPLSRVALTEKQRAIYIKIIPSWIFHRNIQILLDALIAAAAMSTAYLLRYDFQIAPPLLAGMCTWVCIGAVLRPLSLLLCNGYCSTWRFFGYQDGLQLALRSLPLSIFLVAVRWLAHGLPVVPYGVLACELLLFLVFASALRLTRRLAHESMEKPSGRPRALIVGSEDTLNAAIHHFHNCTEAQIIGLVTEDSRLLGLRVAGLPVLGCPANLPALLVGYRIEVVVLSGADLVCTAQVIRDATDFDIQVRVLPSGKDLLGGRVRVSRSLSVEQLASTRFEGLDAVHPEVDRCFAGKTVLVTGAGGSIGSEIVRQLSGLHIGRLVVLDHDENAMFELMSTIDRKKVKEVCPIVGSIRDRETLRQAFDRFRPHITLHAAAYKHVPVMEDNCCEAVLNNISGTRELADAAIEFGCERFVMISTDKAVTPSSVMGATKRTAELLIQQRTGHANGKPHRTEFACVRFGNVLGSRGSVVQTFLRQIAAGGPVTITHEEMTRYFMTIPQAVQLVLQAATLASSGGIYLLDMGDPVKIIDVAKDMIRLAGLTPGKDIAIEVVGIRTGEKMHEQLWKKDAYVTATSFPGVFQVRSTPVTAQFPYLLAQLERSARTRQSNAVVHEMLRALPIDYYPHPVGAFASDAPLPPLVFQAGTSRISSIQSLP